MKEIDETAAVLGSDREQRRFWIEWVSFAVAAVVVVVVVVVAAAVDIVVVVVSVEFVYSLLSSLAVVEWLLGIVAIGKNSLLIGRRIGRVERGKAEGKQQAGCAFQRYLLLEWRLPSLQWRPCSLVSILGLQMTISALSLPLPAVVPLL